MFSIFYFVCGKFGKIEIFFWVRLVAEKIGGTEKKGKNEFWVLMLLLFYVSFWCFKYVNGVACSLLSYCIRFIDLFDYIRTVQQMMHGSIVIC